MSEKEVAEDYKTALDDLDNNSKPLITMLTMLAEENKHFAAAIVQEVVKHINTTTYKLPAMYLIDSIVKNVGSEYKRLFGISIATVFSGVFKKVDESTRKKLYELRQTWNEVFPTSRLYLLDFKIHEVDPAWPMTSQPKLGTPSGTNIYVNPNKFSPQSLKTTASVSPVAAKVNPVASSSQDLKELKKIQIEKRALAETRQKVEKILLKEKEKDKTTENIEKIVSLEPKSNLNPNRQEFLRNFKIKKISPATPENKNSIEPEKKIMPNIYVAPWKAKEIMPKMVSGTPSPSLPKDSRIVTVSPRDSRMPYHANNKVTPRSAIKEPVRDPRLLSQREPHSKNFVSSRETHSKNNILSREDQYSPREQLSSSSRDLRVSGKSLVSAGISTPYNSSLKPSVSTSENRKADVSSADIRKSSGCSAETKLSGASSSDLKKKSGSSIEVKKSERENHKKIKDRDIISKHLKRDTELKIMDSPHRKDKKDLDEKNLREKDFKDKDERDNKDRDDRDKRDRDERFKKDKDDKDIKDADEKENKDKEERLKKEKEERFKKERDEKIKKEKDDWDRKDSDEKEKKDKIENDKREKEERDKKIKVEWDKKFKDEKDKNDLEDKTKKDKDEREKYEKVKKDKDDKSRKDREKSTLHELESSSIKDTQHKVKDELDSIRVDIELKMKEEREELERELKKEERRKTELLLKQRYEQEITEQENERKMKEEVKLAEEKKKQEIETKLNEEKSTRKKKEANIKKPISTCKDKHKEKVKEKSRSETIENEEISSTSSVLSSNKSLERQHSKKTSLQIKFHSPTKSDQSLLSSEEKFKAQTNSSSRRREHIRPRDKTPEFEVNSSNLNNDSTNAVSSSVGSLNISESQNLSKNIEKDTESDDSDHYDANQPRPSIFASNKVKAEEASSCILKTETFIDSSDTDLRSFTSQKNSSSTSNDATKEHASNQLGDLFGTSDTDLRQLPPPPPPPSLHFPLGQTSSTSTGVPPGVIVVNPFLVKPDQDLRENRLPPGIVREEQELKDPRFSRIVEDKESFLNAGTSEDNEEMMGSKKHCFSSPHAAKWEKFREKNPEFKEYQRQASLSEMLLGKDDSNFPPNHERPPSRSGVRSLGRRTRGTEGRQFSFSSQDQDWCIENTGFKSEENYQFMIGQLNEQFKNGEIPGIAYMRMMEGIRLRMEKDKIRELQEKERGDGPSRERWTPELERIGKGSSDEPRPFEDKPMNPDSDRLNAGKFQPYNRGRGRSGPMHQGSGQSGLDPKMEDEWTGEADLPTLSEEVLRAVSKESETRSINIDNIPRMIRTYGEKAIALDEGNDPRTVEFDSVMCNIVFDEGKFSLTMNTRDNYRNFQIDGENHRIRLGVPTQELRIDGKSYQCYFGGKPISVYLAGKDRVIRLDGKPPQVVFGATKNMDYLVGKVELIIDAKKIVNLFLDAKPQQFTIDGMPFVLKFIDSFKAVAINGVKFPVIFGGLPISISVRGYRRFLRFSALPPGVIPGKTSVKGMDSDGSTLIPSYPSSPPPNRDGPPAFSPAFNVLTDQAPPIRPSNCNQIPSFPVSTGVTYNQAPPLVPPLAPPPFPMLMKPPQIPIQVPPQILRMSHPPPVCGGVIPGSYLTTPTPQQHQSMPSTSVPPPSVTGANFQMPNVSTPAVPFVDVQSLLSNLLKTGLIGSKKKDESKEAKEKKKQDEKTKLDKEAEEEEIIDDLKDLPSIETMFNLDNLRKPNVKLITKMYRGMQCSSCGLRYPPDQTAQYSHHLDWHFRMNKKQQESTKKVNTRKFYLCIDDWLQYEEIEDIEERVPSMFEMDGETDSKSSVDKDEDAEEEIPSVSASSSDPCLGVCPICHETFDQFYHHNTEEWHYKYAIQVDGINYHPVCHQDLIKAQKNKEEKLRLEEEEKAKNLKLKEEERLQKEEELEKLHKEEELEKLHKEEELEKLHKEELEKLQKEEDLEKLHKEEELEKLHKESELGSLNKEAEIEKLKEEKDLENLKIKNEEDESQMKAEVDISEIESLDLDDESEAIKEIPFTVKKVDIPEINIEEEKLSDESLDDSATPTKTDTCTKKVKHSNSSIMDKTNNAAFNGFGSIKIKDEPIDTDDGLRVEVLSRVPTLLADIPIKVELPDDDGFYEGDAPQTFEVEDEDEMHDDNDDHVNAIANDSWTNQTNSPDIAISIDGNTEIISQPEATQSTNSIPKIKISVSKPSLINNNIEHLENDKNTSLEDDRKKIPSFLEEFDDEFIPPPFTVDLKVKPAFEGVELINYPVEQRGLEISSLCSIM